MSGTTDGQGWGVEYDSTVQGGSMCGRSLCSDLVIKEIYQKISPKQQNFNKYFYAAVLQVYWKMTITTKYRLTPKITTISLFAIIFIFTTFLPIYYSTQNGSREEPFTWEFQLTIRQTTWLASKLALLPSVWNIKGNAKWEMVVALFDASIKVCVYPRFWDDCFLGDIRW